MAGLQSLPGGMPASVGMPIVTYRNLLVLTGATDQTGYFRNIYVFDVVSAIQTRCDHHTATAFFVPYNCTACPTA